MGDGGIGEDGVGEEVEGGGCRSGVGDVETGVGEVLMLIAGAAEINDLQK